MVLNKLNSKIKKRKLLTITQLSLCILLIFSVIQILPIETKIINDASASSTWTDINWLHPENYTQIDMVDIIKHSGDVRLLFDKGLIVLDSLNGRIVKTTLDGNGWAAYGTYGSGTGQLRNPYGIYFDNNTGDIYVADTDNYRIVKTMIDGTGWTTIGSYGTGMNQFNRPADVDFDKDSGFVYVADGANMRVVKTKINGSSWTSLKIPVSGYPKYYGVTKVIYDNSSDFLYTVGGWRITKIKMDGSNCTSYGGYGQGIGQGFTYIYGLSYDSANDFIYVSDSLNYKFIRLKMNGSGWKEFGTKGSGRGQFDNPMGLYYDTETDSVYIADSYNHRIVRTNLDGTTWSTIGTQGSGKGQFWYPKDVEVFSTGLFCKNGSMVSRILNFGGPLDIFSLSWQAKTPKSTSIKFQMRSGKDESTCTQRSFVGPEGSTKKYYTTSGSKVWSGHCGDQFIQYKAYLSTTDRAVTPILKDVSMDYNLLPTKPILILPFENAWTKDNTTTFTWQHNDTDSTSQKGFQWQLDGSPKFDFIRYDSEEVISSESTYTSEVHIPDGIWYWRIRTQDSDDGWGPYSEPRKLIIDTRPPSSEIVLPQNKKFYQQMTKFKGIANDPHLGCGVDKVDLSINCLNTGRYWNGNGWDEPVAWLPATGNNSWMFNSSRIIWTSNFRYFAQSRAWDTLTNCEIPNTGIEFVIDSDSPISIVNKPINNSAYNKLNQITGSSFDVGGSGVKNVEISIQRTSDNKYWDGEVWVQNIVWLYTTGTPNWTFDSPFVKWTPGIYYIVTAKAIDMIDNIEQPINNNKFLFDPHNPVSSIEYPANDIYINDLQNILGNASDPGGAGIEHTEITIQRMGNNNYWTGETWNPDLYWLLTLGTESFTYNTSGVDWVTDNYYTISPRAIDNAGNYQVTRLASIFMFDNKPPERSIIINEGAEFNRTGNISIQLAASDSGSGITDMAFSFNNSNWTTWEPFKENKQFTLSQNENDGVKNLSFKVKDLAGNIAEPVFDTIILDSSPPMCTIQINNDDELTNTRKVTLTLDAYDLLSGIHDMSFSLDNLSWSDWQPFNVMHNYLLPSDDGWKIIYFKVRDGAGNIATTWDSITLDTTPPHSLKITINNGSLKTTSNIVTLDLQAFDELSGVDQMAFGSNKYTLLDWTDFKTTEEYTIPYNNGMHIVYFNVKDKAGNIAEPVCEVILITQDKDTSNDPLDKDEDPEPPLDKTSDSILIWIIFVVITAIILGIIVLFLLIRKKKLKKKLQEKEAVTIRPKETPTPKPTLEKPPVAKPEAQIPAKPTIDTSSQFTQTAIPKPTLVPSPIVAQTPTQKQIPETQKMPQLPPAKASYETTPTIAQEPKE